MSSINRKRLACTACTRRKVKCDKEIPCSNCIRKGVQHACTREDETTVKRALSNDSADPSHPDASQFRDGMNSGSEEVVQALKRRVVELEAALHSSADRPGAPAQKAINVFRVEPPNQKPGGNSANNGAAGGAPKGSNPNASLPIKSKDAEIEDAATILEFLAWGRRKNPEYNSIASPKLQRSQQRIGDVGDVKSTQTMDDMHFQTSHVQFLQLLLPERMQLWQLVDYHLHCLLWYHGSFYAPTFRKHLEDFLNNHDGLIESDGINLQWVALLFSILTVSISCAPAHQLAQWGFRESEQEILSKRWFRAVITCLNLAEYMANHTIFSVQAIATLTLAAHLLGYSNNQSALLASATRIGQALGLHKLASDATGTAVEKETGRRAWAQLCTQDWFSIPFSETYLINPLYNNSEMPTNCHDHDMTALPESTPTINSFCRIHLQIAAVMPQLQDGMTMSNTPYTRYEQVLRFDKQLRELNTTKRAAHLDEGPMQPDWPHFVPWARRALAISASHKIIMVHRKFLGASFTNPAFNFTQKTCIAAAKTIIKEYKAVILEDGPVFWIHQAFSVAAGIILCLSLLHHDPREREYTEHRQLVEDAASILRNCRNSMIATRGARLLFALVSEADRFSREVQLGEKTENPRKRRVDDMNDNNNPDANGKPRLRSFDINRFVKNFAEGCTIQSTAKPPTIRMQPDAPPQQPHPYFVQPVTQMPMQAPLSTPPMMHHDPNSPNYNPQQQQYYQHMQHVPPQQQQMQQDPNVYSTMPPQQVGVQGYPQMDMHAGQGFENMNSFENLLYLANQDLSFI